MDGSRIGIVASAENPASTIISVARQKQLRPPATAFLPEEQKQAMAHMTPLGRNALPEDVAGAVLAMASDATGFVSGAYLPVSGGTQMP